MAVFFFVLVRSSTGSRTFNYEPVRQRAVRVLNASLGLRRIRTDDVDVQLVIARPNCYKPGPPTASSSLGDAKHSQILAVERARLPVSFEIRTSGREVIVSRFRVGKPKLLEACSTPTRFQRPHAMHRTGDDCECSRDEYLSGLRSPVGSC